MIKFSKAAPLAAAMALIGLLASSASAAEWHTNGDKTLASTSVGSTRLTTHSNGVTIPYGCTNSSLSGTLSGPTSTMMPWIHAATVTLAFTGCQTAGGSPFTLTCAPARLRANSYVGGVTFPTAGAGITTGQIHSIDCTISIGATTCSTIAGSVPIHYINPIPIVVGAGSVTVTSVGQTLTTARIGAGCGLFPHGATTLGRPLGATGITDLTYPVHGPNAPYIYRTP